MESILLTQSLSTFRTVKFYRISGLMEKTVQDIMQTGTAFCAGMARMVSMMRKRKNTRSISLMRRAGCMQINGITMVITGITMTRMGRKFVESRPLAHPRIILTKTAGCSQELP